MDTSEPTWALILDSLYSSEQAAIRKAMDPDPDCLVNREDLAGYTDEFPDNQINQTIRFLKNNELLRREENENGDQVYILTQEGFSVAHNRHILQEQQSREQTRTRNQLQINQAIGYLTVGLLLAAVLNPIIQYVSRTELLTQMASSALLFILILTNLVIVGIIISKLWRSGLLTTDLEA